MWSSRSESAQTDVEHQSCVWGVKKKKKLATNIDDLLATVTIVLGLNFSSVPLPPVLEGNAEEHMTDRYDLKPFPGPV